MGRTSTFETGLVMLAFIAVVFVFGLMLLASPPETPSIPAPAPRVEQASEQEMEDAWQNLVDAIRNEDQEEALRLAEWLDEQHGLKEHATEVVQDWCEHKSQDWDFCKEGDDVKE